MAAASEPAAEQESPVKLVKYYSYCPCGTECSKGNATLGGFWSEQRAREAVFTHLTCSPYHKMPEGEAKELADSAEIMQHEWEEGAEEDEDITIRKGTRAKVRARRSSPPPEPVEAPRSRRRRRSEGSASSRRVGQSDFLEEADYRAHPAASEAQQRNSKRASEAAQSTAVAVVNQQLQDGIAVQTRNAMSFVRAMTRAEKALRLAETVSRRAMETFQDMVASKGGCTCCGMTACGSTAKGFLDFL